MNEGYSRRNFLFGTGIAAIALSFGSKFNLLAAKEKGLNFMNWDTYIGPNTISDFRKVSGIEVKTSLFSSNDELFGKLQNGNPGYDVIVPTGDNVERMIELDMLVPLNKNKIPNFKNLFDEFKDASFDNGRKYSITYMWGTVGIGYNKTKLKGKNINSWKYLYDSDEFAGRIALASEAKDLIGSGLKYLGYSANDTNPKRIKEVEKLLIAQKKNIKAFHNDNGQDMLISKEVDLVQEYNGDISQVMLEDKELSYLLPKEGSLQWQDNLAIPKGAPHVENAHAFINFLLDAEAGRAIADEIRYATPNKAAYNLMDEEYRNNPAIYPDKESLKKSEVLKYGGIKYNQLLDETITRITSA